jgi:cell division protein ZapA
MAELRVVHVDIQGQRYAIRSELDPKYVSDVAAFVDRRMETAGRELPTADAVRVAVVSALNIADELFRAREQTGGAEARLLARAADLERVIDEALAEATPDGRVAGVRAAR